VGNPDSASTSVMGFCAAFTNALTHIPTAPVAPSLKSARRDPPRIPLDRLIEDGFETLIHHNDTAVKIIVHP
jgi:hypothetical protein